MFQKFFTSTIMSKFIKNLLYSESIPLLKCIDEDDYIIPDCLYIYKDYVIKCVTSGLMKVNESEELYPSDTVHPENWLYPGTGEAPATWIVVGYYDADNRKYNYNYKSTTSYYDSDTHRHLGNYLRFLRDRKKLDLMHLYNCYNYSIIEDVTLNYVPVVSRDYSITIPSLYPHDDLFPAGSLYPNESYTIDLVGGSSNTVQPSAYDRYPSNSLFPANSLYPKEVTIAPGRGGTLYPNYNLYPSNTLFPGTYSESKTVPAYTLSRSTSTKLLAIPIKFNQTYTVAIECPTRVLMRSIIYGSSGMTRTDYNSDLYYSDFQDMIDSYRVELSTSFNRPFTYKVDTSNSALYNHEKDLYLVIQIPKSNNSSIVVLEGDYTNLNSVKTDVNSVRVYNTYKNLSLLKLDSHETYAFSDRLIEYMLNNVITHLDVLTDNIDRAQTALANVEDTYARLSAKSAISMGVWDDGLKHSVLRLVDSIKDTIYLQDQDGYINKDIENVLYHKGVYVS